MEVVKILFWVLVLVAASPFITFFCVKWGTIAWYKAKEFMNKEKCEKDCEE